MIQFPGVAATFQYPSQTLGLYCLVVQHEVWIDRIRVDRIERYCMPRGRSTGDRKADRLLQAHHG